MNITELRLYNAPYEYESADRFYKDVLTKLDKYIIGVPITSDIENKLSYVFTNTTTAEFTITSDERPSFIAIKSNLFKNTEWSFWFLDGVKSIESEYGTRYDANLDVIATHGENIFTSLEGNKIKVKRMHEDRYTYDGTNFNMNTKHHSLINSDFKVGDTKGVELVYDGANETNSDSNSEIEIFKKISQDWTVVNGLETISINNKISQDNKDYFIYALIQFKGKPVIYDKNAYRVERPNTPNVNVIEVKKEIITSSNSALRNSVIVPISTDNDGINNINIITLLQNEKVLNIIKLPYKLNLDTGFQIVWSELKGRFAIDEADNIVDTNLETEDTIHAIYPKIPLKDEPIAYELYAYNTIDSIGLNTIEIPTSKLNAKEIMDFIVNTSTPAEMKSIIDNKQEEKLEIGLLNPSIMPISMYFNENETLLDIYNFTNKIDKTRMLGLYTLNEMGLETNIKISENQFHEWSENTIMSFATDQGSTYLARNKYTIDAQKKGATLNAELQKNQISQQQAGQYSGGLIGGFLSMLNPANWAASAIRGQSNNIVDKIADNKKQQIQAAVNDASATAPSMHMGTEHNLANLNTEEFSYNFNWVMKKPNPYLRDKIVMFYDRHGYLFNDWITFQNSILETRTKFNYLEIDEFMDFVGTMKDFDINSLKELDKEFKKGIRLWHVNDINYNDPNIEKVINENI